MLRRGLPLEAALPSAAADLERPDDRGLAHALAAGVLRHMADLDRLIDGATEKRLPADAKARAVLRLALFQALGLETPPHAAITTVLPLVDGGPRRLVHGVFGAVMRKGARLPEVPALPPAVEARWKAAWGAKAVSAAARAGAAPPPLDLTLRDPAETASWAERLGGTSLMPGHVRLPRGTAVPDLPGFAEGAWWVQDLAASLPARLIGAGGGRAFDLCAAPGGKTLQLAAAGWAVTALDASEARLGRVRENLDRIGLNAGTVQGDVMQWAPPAPAEAVLLDAPCSATGIFRRHPDVLHRASARAIADLAAQQAAMLARAADWVKPGGRLVYSVCSAEPEEGERVAAGFARAGFAVDPVAAAELPDGLAPDASGMLRVPPGALAEAGGADGFFVARFRRIHE